MDKLRCVCCPSTRTCVYAHARLRMSMCACLRSCAGVTFCSLFFDSKRCVLFSLLFSLFLLQLSELRRVHQLLGVIWGRHTTTRKAGGGEEGKWGGGMEEGRGGKPSPKGKKGLNRKGFLSSVFFLCRTSSSSALAFVPLHNPCAIASPDRCDETPTASDFHKEAGKPAVPPGAQWPSRPADSGQDEAACQKGHPQDEQSWSATA